MYVRFLSVSCCRPDGVIVTALAKSIPSIESFNDQGDLTIPDGLAERTVEEDIEVTCACSIKW
jgi:hypothetical protein